MDRGVVTERIIDGVEKKRYICDCQARVHNLLSNCLNCGRVICELEGRGDCAFCGLLVESKEQQLQEYHERTKKMKASTPRPDYSTFVGGQPATRFVATGGVNNQALQFPVLESEEAAEERKNKLLSYDQDEVSRSRVHDESGDFDYKEKVDDKWLSVEERATAHNV
jgi:hypothetical protein